MSNNPATPPRSRWSNMEPTEDLPKKQLLFPATPNKGNELGGPMTPSTVHKNGSLNVRNQLSSQPQANGMGNANKLVFKNGPFLQPPQENAKTAINSPFNGLKSPEYTPMRRLSITGKKGTLNSVSRVLFPTDHQSLQDNTSANNSDEPARKKLNVPGILLPPSTPKQQPTSITDSETFNTPNEKITNFELSKEWYNKDYAETANDSDIEDNAESQFISKETMENPFMSSGVPSKETRVLRKMQLMEEEPDLDKYITYVNKRGEKVKQRRLSRNSQKLKPKMLFEDQLYSEDRSDIDLDL
ncbi:similar to Saccharomyces cerevisiae YLR079W SIC1 Inhibitor of Cdc28-Clb kinase complexes that controls G1/S phase transition, preventing premature S phase and ensuring genomic integrity [Maudiozyma barnettii]|uniref:Similar to Saccharomyces cerevisiae YLR079W SIC1 Inhibitor of Cdc28-Clb kinase complexes that controls G1/S phase transition, preventing premature S phase and ensuring genomic integrity n=1 Tax=Maudiozyma barnettii TaxID=61262 RepID=A0A8H2ZG37_9SACH|nr:cyclin-dependent protein serine/threonine kinase inhibiting protein SIC1 [Kazachstania barnettii]CAB4254154.1 similar to Saccharomyces cerevisiae YLR079W SIC1 Inhibitor of Cdc28-Clb kinase complexes that controls G1/S phase transition, preventing premature S phase and ensuring genomic integrity [Kazachstania barnettii]CAD1781904.1 similar to Saccharomyces cerevisiae YLR079W SIC1 Inhibitor of Cdc28-Clb kinase complexes that controls G1/S phase transition, preventing premature S phase and ensuri